MDGHVTPENAASIKVDVFHSETSSQKHIFCCDASKIPPLARMHGFYVVCCQLYDLLSGIALELVSRRADDVRSPLVINLFISTLLSEGRMKVSLIFSHINIKPLNTTDETTTAIDDGDGMRPS
jgi:hypothetical protein